MANLHTLRHSHKVFTGPFSNIAADGFVTLSGSGQDSGTLMDIGDIDWERIVVDLDITALTGTNVIGKLKTCNVKSGTAIAATTMDAKNGAGTANVSSTATAAGRELHALARMDTDSGPSNVGRFIGYYLDTSSITDLDGTVTIYVGK